MTSLLQPLRRWLAPLFILALAAPSLGMLFTRSQHLSTLEKRMLATAPAWPDSLAAGLSLPRRVDAYLQDHFAFRPFLTAAGNRLRWRLGGQVGGGSVLRGEGDWLFLRDNLLDVTGGLVRRNVAEDYGAFVCDMDRRLKARAIPMVFSMAPSPAAIYPEALPGWVPRGRPSDYDLIVERTRACGVATVDLRPALLAAKPGGSIYYRRDTHWTEKGALIAYDRLVQKLGKPDWTLAPDRLAWRQGPEDRSDLASMSGVTGLRPLAMTVPDLSTLGTYAQREPIRGVTEDVQHLGFIDKTGRAGPTVLIVGDSYSADFLPPFFAAHVGRFAWTHQEWCRFDWNVFDAVRPDYVILMPADRWAACRKGARPLHMPVPAV